MRKKNAPEDLKDKVVSAWSRFNYPNGNLIGPISRSFRSRLSEISCGVAFRLLGQETIWPQMNTARHSRNQKNIHHRATETLRKTKSKAKREHEEVAEATEAQGPRGFGVLVALVRADRRGVRIAATKLKRLELLENPCSARRFRTLVVQINTSRLKQSSSRFQELRIACFTSLSQGQQVSSRRRGQRRERRLPGPVAGIWDRGFYRSRRAMLPGVPWFLDRSPWPELLRWRL